MKTKDELPEELVQVTTIVDSATSRPQRAAFLCGVTTALIWVFTEGVAPSKVMKTLTQRA